MRRAGKHSLLILVIVAASLPASAAVSSEVSKLARSWIDDATPQARARLANFAEQARQPEAAYARLALGYGDYLNEDYGAAVKALDHVERQASPIAEYAAYYRAKSYSLEEHYEQAAWVLRDFEKDYPSSRLVPAAARIRVESLIRDNRLREAEALLLPKKSAVAEPARLYLLGRVQELTNRTQQAIKTYREVYYYHPTSSEADASEDRLDEIRKTVGGGYPAAPDAWRLARADRSFKAGDMIEAARQYGYALDGLKGAELERARQQQAIANYRSLRTSAAYDQLLRYTPSDPKLQAERLYYLGECERRKDLVSKFRDRAEQLAKSFPKSQWYEQALFSLGNYYLLENNGPESRRYYERTAREFPKGEYADVAHWKVCWRSYLDRDPRAEALFEEHVRLYPDSSQASAALYWIARIRQKAGDEAIANSLYQEIDRRYPNYYYAMLARERLRGAGVITTPAPQPVSLLTAKLPGSRQLSPDASPETVRLIDRGRLLYDLGLYGDAESELALGDYRGPDAYLIGLELFRETASQERYHKGLRYMKRYGFGYLRMPLDAMPRDFWEGLYPLPWRDQLTRRAEPQNLDPYLVAGLIRQESEFNQLAVSRAGAMGLMQLMPATGKETFRRLGIPGFTRAKLHNPDISMRLGTFHLKETLDQFSQLEVALAAYNAGPNRAKEWITWGDFKEPAEFVETIPFTETRGYVQSVLRNRDMYQRLYDRAQGETETVAGR